MVGVEKKKAMGGGLFSDEARALVDGGDSFAHNVAD